MSRHRSDVVGCAQPSERSARRSAQPIPRVLASDATPRCASMASADRQMIGDATLGWRVDAGKSSEAMAAYPVACPSAGPVIGHRPHARGASRSTMKRRRRCGARPRGASLRRKAVLRTDSCCGAFEHAAQRKYGPGLHAVGDRFGALPPLAAPDGGPVQRAEEGLGGAPGRPGGRRVWWSARS
ncbi:hypothetical protein Veis_0144 [Verminephrobacter eiseniae EF01-2]|uniref:Uncharacterized protein n=1 Tax=Verminephrobacter eiseniae (strain EF01-2) TaxID=391735 RepID=A1WE79_VEREI|nr:hypothetical protein [Verminephrobacter eiseniae]ABM55936.1 hypothetical protein Veis_0144 [Verminephrobacter eiseniae EF01-2]MCW5286312.1 hypothetical protein [Verminephrobacter eiseniae]MCW8192841.1 hypothetical protein [Verminephrobacter eiseniae]